MVQETFVRLKDDLEGGAAVETVQFGYQGVNYEIDLNKKNSDALGRALAKYVEAGRKVAGGRGRQRRGGGSGRSDLAEIRAWAKSHRHKVSDRGRVPAKVIEAYDKSTKK